MSLFKIKSNKQVISDERITLDAKHLNITKKFKTNKTNLKTMKKELKKYKEKYVIYKKSLKKLNMDELTEYYKLNDNITKLTTDIKNINKNKDEHDYFLNTADVLYKYYNIDGLTKTDNTEYVKTSNNTTIVDFFSPKPVENEVKQKPSTDINNKATLLNEYLKTVDKNSYRHQSLCLKKNDRCTKCNVEKYLYQNEGTMICPSCGEIDYVVIDSDKPNYKDPPPEVSYFAYKRINHFNEWLAQFQAKESTEIPQMVFDKILMEIKKERIENMAILTNKKIREYLKKLKLNKYYEHVPHIINRLNGLPPPIMSREVEEKLRVMFKEIQAPFLEVRPKNRKNFLSYSYVLHKFVELLELNEYKACFPLLKSRAKLHEQDLIWRDICKKLKWQYIKSI